MALHETITPAGISIVFEDGEPDPQTGKAKRRSYLVNGEKLPSITTVVGVLDKPGLMYGAEKLAVKAAIELAREGELPSSVPGALSRMTARDLRFFQVWRKKADRGTVTHEDLVKLCMGEEPGELDSFSKDQVGFIRGASSWFADEQPRIETAEEMVASIEHGYAGRPDLFGVLPHQHPTAKALLEVKTTEELPRDKKGNVKPPYPEHLLQLAGQELARRESGYEASDYQAVLRIDASGEADLFTTVVDPASFVAVLGAYKALRGLSTKPQAPKAAVAA